MGGGGVSLTDRPRAEIKGANGAADKGALVSRSPGKYGASQVQESAAARGSREWRRPGRRGAASAWRAVRRVTVDGRKATGLLRRSGAAWQVRERWQLLIREPDAARSGRKSWPTWRVGELAGRVRRRPRRPERAAAERAPRCSRRAACFGTFALVRARSASRCVRMAEPAVVVDTVSPSGPAFSKHAAGGHPRRNHWTDVLGMGKPDVGKLLSWLLHGLSQWSMALPLPHDPAVVTAVARLMQRGH